MPPARRATPRITVDEYLRTERAAEERRVYLDGRLRGLGRQGIAHATIADNLSVLVDNQLRAASHAGRVVDAWVYAGPADPAAGMLSRPDLAAVRDEPAWWGGRADVFTNPALVVEVLTPSTLDFAQSEQMHRLGRWTPSLTEYLLVRPRYPSADLYTREGDGWLVHFWHGLDAAAEVPSLGLRMPLADVYDRVTFPDPDPDA